MPSILNNLSDIWRKTNVTQRVVLIGVVLGVLVAAWMLLNWASKPEMEVLYSELTPEDAAKVTERLDEMSVPYELAGNGTTILVEDGQKYKLRLNMAAAGLPSSGNAGYSVLDDEKLGVSPSTQKVNIRRALEGELAKSIMFIDGVRSARVHLVQPEGVRFGKKQKDAKAAVVLKLKPNRSLTPENVSAIVQLVAFGGGEDIRPENVSVVDDQGRPLSGDAMDPFAKSASTFLSYKMQIEQYYIEKVESMLAKVLGPERAAVKVDAKIDPSRKSKRTETYLPDPVIAREVERSKSKTTTAAKANPSEDKERESESEYLASREIADEQLPAGQVEALSVAAFVDLSDREGAKPAVTIQQVEQAIRNALGGTRVDSLQVVESPFMATATGLEGAEELPEESMFSKEFMLEIARRSSLGILVIGALVALRMLRGTKRVRAASKGQPALEGEGAPRKRLGSVSEDPETVRAQIASALQENPDEVKQLFLSWVDNDQKGA